MLDGLYAVRFKAAEGEGGGTVVIANDSINGGDHSHSYQGKLEKNGQGIWATLEVSQFNPSNHSVFGSSGNFELEVSGPTSEKNFELTGHVKGSPAHKINISGNYLKPLV